MKKFFVLIGLLVLTSIASYTQTGTLPEGSNIVVRLTDRLSSDTNNTGDVFHAMLDQDLVSDGRVLARAGDPANGKLVEVRDAGKVSGRARMVLTLTEIDTGGALTPVDTNEITVEADSSKKRDAGMVGGGAALGAIIGAIAGGGKGAAIGAAVGAAAGTGGVLVTAGKDVVFEAEQKFNFVARQAVSFDPRSTGAPRYGQNRTYNRGREGNYPYQTANDPGQFNDIARNLSDRAQDAWNLVRDRRDDNAGGRRIDSALYDDLRNFADRTRDYSSSSNDSYRAENGRTGARRLIELADRITRQLENSAPDTRLRDEWNTVQDQVAQLGDYFGLPYSSDRSLARSDPYNGGYADPSGGSLRWRGRVDGSDSIYLRGDRVTIRHINAQPITDSSFNLPAPLPRSAVNVQLRKLQGRGSVELVQQPSASNSYTAVVTIRDDDPGADFYEFELTW